MALVIRFSTPGRQGGDDIEIDTHSNDTVGSVRRQVLRRIKATGSNVKLDLYNNGDLLDPGDDRRLLSYIPIRDKTVSHLVFYKYCTRFGIVFIMLCSKSLIVILSTYHVV